MSSFTVKDFIKLNSPCFCCGCLTELHAIAHPKNYVTSTYLNTKVCNNKLEVQLSIKYNSSVSLSIDLKTNKFVASCSMDTLKNYLNENRLSILVYCEGCSSIESDSLTLNLYKGFIKPIEMDTEFFCLRDKNQLYEVSSNYYDEETRVLLTTYSGYDKIASETVFIYPLISRYKFKDREAMISKLKLYTTLS